MRALCFSKMQLPKSFAHELEHRARLKAVPGSVARSKADAASSQKSLACMGCFGNRAAGIHEDDLSGAHSAGLYPGPLDLVGDAFQCAPGAGVRIERAQRA